MRGGHEMGISIQWDITNRCNLACAHCVKGDELNSTAIEPSLEEVKQIIDHLSEKQIDHIQLLGGEPTTRKDFIEITSYIDQKGIRFGFNTNGLLMGEDKTLNAVTSLKSLKGIVFSIEAPIAEINDQIRGKAVFDKTIANLKKLIAHKKENNYNHFHVVVNTVVSKVNKDYILPMIHYCAEIGVNELCLLQLVPQGNAEDKNFSLSFDEELQIVTEIANIYPSIKDKLRIIPSFVRAMAVDYVNEVLEKDFPPVEHGCTAGTESACISHLGELYSCYRYIKPIVKQHTPKELSLIHNPFDKIWAKNEFSDIFSAINQESFYQHTEPCNTCYHLKESCWPCPAPFIGQDGSNRIMDFCIQYDNLIQEHHLKDNCEIVATKQLIREVAANDEDYVLFNTETFETLTISREGYLIWKELRAMDKIQYHAAISVIRDKYAFTVSDIKEVIDSLVELDYLEKQAS